MDWVTYGINYLNTEKLLNAKEEIFFTINYDTGNRWTQNWKSTDDKWALVSLGSLQTKSLISYKK